MEGETGFLQWMQPQAFFWRGEPLSEAEARMPFTISTLQRLLC